MNNHHFPPTNRLKKTPQFRQILDKNHKIYSRFWILFYAENNLSPSRPRLGIIVSKKVSLLAVRRNKIKRIVREFFRQNKTNFIGYDMIIIAKKTHLKFSNKLIKELADDLLNLKKKLNKKINIS